MMCLFVLLLAADTSAKPVLQSVIQASHGGAVESVHFSTDGGTLVSAGSDESIVVWDLRSSKAIRTFRGRQPVLLDNGKQLLLTDDVSSRIVDVLSGDVVHDLGNLHCDVFSLSPDERFIYFARSIARRDAQPGTIERRELGGGSSYQAYTLSEPEDKEILSLVVSDSGEWVQVHWKKGLGAHTLPDEKVTYRKLNFTKRESKEQPKDERFSGRRSYAASNLSEPMIVRTKTLWAELRDPGTADEEVRVFHEGAETENVPYIEYGRTTNIIRGFDLSYDGQVLAVATSPRSPNDDKNNIIRIVEMERGWEVKDLIGDAATAFSTAMSDNGRYVAVGADDGSASVWDLAVGRLVQRFALSEKTGFAPVKAVAFNPGATLLATTSSQGATVWNVGTGAKVSSFGGPCDATGTVFSADGSSVMRAQGIVTTSTYPHTEIAASFDAKTGKKLKAFNAEGTYKVHGLLMHQRGLFAFAGSPKTIITWDPTQATTLRFDAVTGAFIRRYDEPAPIALETAGIDRTVAAIAVSPDGETLATAATIGTNAKQLVQITVFDLESGKVRATIPALTHVETLALSYTPDGKYLAAALSDTTVRMWDAKTLQPARSFTGHGNAVRAIAFSKDGSRMLSGSADASAKLWRVDTGQEIASLVAIGNNDFVIATPDNYYTSSKGANRGMAFRQGRSVYAFDQFDLRLNRPDIVLGRLGLAPPALIHGYQQARAKRLKKMHFTEAMVSGDVHVPELAIVGPPPPTSTRERKLSVQLEIKDESAPLERINVFVNHVPIFGKAGISLSAKRSKKIKQTISFLLSNNRNSIQISAANAKGAVSLEQSFEVTYQGPGAVTPDLYVVAIGVSEYRDSAYNLRYAAKDANDLVAMLQSKRKDFEAYHQVHVLRITDKDATKENILKARAFLQRSTVEDEVVVFVASHGLLDDQLDYYIATTDVDFSNPAQRGLRYEALEDLLDGIGARNKLLLIDACNSGEVDKEDTILSTQTQTNVAARGFKAAVRKPGSLGLNESFEVMQDLFSDLRRGTGAAVISSASGVEFAYEGETWKNGVFTYATLDGLKDKKADANADGIVTVSELKAHVSKAVLRLTNGGQHPTSRRENLENNFAVW